MFPTTPTRTILIVCKLLDHQIWKQKNLFRQKSMLILGAIHAKHSTSGNRTRGICVTGRYVPNYTNADDNDRKTHLLFAKIICSVDHLRGARVVSPLIIPHNPRNSSWRRGCITVAHLFERVCKRNGSVF